MERNIIIENICTACRCGERRAEEYLAAELRNLRELRDAGALCYGVTEALKASDPMKWVGLMNTLKAQAEETILTELVFS